MGFSLDNPVYLAVGRQVHDYDIGTLYSSVQASPLTVKINQLVTNCTGWLNN